MSLEILLKVAVILCTTASFESNHNPFQHAAKTHLLHCLFIFSLSAQG